MFLQLSETGAEPACFSLTFYLCAAAVMVICFAIAIKQCGKWDGD